MTGAKDGRSARSPRLAESGKPRSAADLTTIVLVAGAMALLWRLVG